MNKKKPTPKGKRSAKKGDSLSIRWKTDYYKVQLEKLIETKEIPADMSKIEGRYDFRNLNLRKQSLNGLSLKNVCLNTFSGYSSKFSNCEISASFVKKGDFAEVELVETQLTGTIFSGCSFRKTVFNTVQMENAIFENCDFTGATFKKIQVENTIIDNSNFTNLVSPETAEFVGTPKSIKNVTIDEHTFSLLKESPFKSAMILKAISVEGDVV